jgi:hypothetical protein
MVFLSLIPSDGWIDLNNHLKSNGSLKQCFIHNTDHSVCGSNFAINETVDPLSSTVFLTGTKTDRIPFIGDDVLIWSLY